MASHHHRADRRAMDRLRLLELKPSPAGFFRGWYERDIAALFTEADPYFEAGEDDERTSCGYQTTARQMRERRQARGFSAQRAWSGLASAVAKWPRSRETAAPREAWRTSSSGMPASLRTFRSIGSRSIRRPTISPPPSWCTWTRGMSCGY